MSISHTVADRIALITLERPPVNSLNRALRRELLAAVQAAQRDPMVDAMVLWGGARLFCAGADIMEFAGGAEGDAMAEPTLPALVAAIESSPKPTVAAIAGPCMGGGLELALGCHFRLLDSSARLSLPEIRLGLLPGAGGTQRLPRLIGVDPALRMILSGETLDGPRAASLGIGELVSGDLQRAALERAQRAIGQPLQRVSDLTAHLPDGAEAAAYWHAQHARLRSPLPAPLKVLQAVKAAVALPFAEGMHVEETCFAELLRTPEAGALQYAFLGDRRASLIDQLPAHTEAARIDAIGVVGAGTMGTGIALSALNAGLPTWLVDANAEFLERARSGIRASLDQAVAKGRLNSEERERRWSLLHTAVELQGLGQVDLVIEAVFEDLAVKTAVFRALERIAKPAAVLATNTSTLDIDRIARATTRPADIVGLHFFSPANVMRLLEVVRAADTSPTTLATAFAFAKRIEKVPVLSRVCDGFIGNRMFEEYLRQAYFLLELGATPWQVDDVLEAWGMAMGPFAVMDLAGGDIGWAIRKRRAVERPYEVYSVIPDRICELGRFGRKTGAGYYRYDSQGVRQPDPVIEDLISNHRRDMGLKVRKVADDEIVDRCILALVNEGARLLRERVAQRASDIDVVYRNGYGFPAHRGGPMYYADHIGLAEVVRRSDALWRGYHGEFWATPPLLLDCLRRRARLADAQAPKADS